MAARMLATCSGVIAGALLPPLDRMKVTTLLPDRRAYRGTAAS